MCRRSSTGVREESKFGYICHNNYHQFFLLHKPLIQIGGPQNIQHNYHHCQIVFKACFCCNGGGGLENDQTGLTILSNSPAVSCFSPYLIIVIIIMSIITTTDIGQNKHVQADQYVRLVENVNKLKDILKCLS